MSGVITIKCINTTPTTVIIIKYISGTLSDVILKYAVLIYKFTFITLRILDKVH